MAKRSGKISLSSVLGAGRVRQGMLFEDAFTDLQEDVLTMADGTRSVGSIAAALEKPREKVLQIVRKLYHDGYLEVESPEAVLSVCSDVLAQGRLEDGIGLYRFVLEHQPENLEAMASLAELYVRTAHAREAAGVFSKLAYHYTRSARLGEALVVLRKAAGLQAGNFQIQDDLAKLCADTGRNEEAARVWRGYAMRLAGAGEYKEALEIVDNAVAKIGGNDTLFYAEAEILALMEGKERHETIDIPQSDVIESSELETESSEVHDELKTVFDVDDERESAGEAGISEKEGVTAEAGYDAADLTADSDRKFADIRLRGYESSPSQAGAKSINGRKIFYALLVMAILLLILAGVNYSYRSAMYSAVLESKGLGSLIQDATLIEKVGISEEALAVLEANRPPFAFMQSSEYRNQLARIRQLVMDTNDELMKNNIAFDKLVQEWQLGHNEILAGRIMWFADNEVLTGERTEKAKELYRLWLAEKGQKARELSDYIEVLADKELGVDLRFSAYQNLLVNFPYVFEWEYPKGVRGLTVPSRIIAEIEGSSKPLDLELAGAERRSDGYWEIPVDPGAGVVIEHYGYSLGLSGINIGKTKMPYPLTEEQFFVLKKEAVVDLNIDMGFVPEVGSVVEGDGKLFFSSRNEYKLIDLITGTVAGKGEYNARVEGSVRSVGLDAFNYEDWLGVLNDGTVYVSRIVDGRAGKMMELKGAAGDILFAGFTDLELGNYDGAGVVAGEYFSSEKDKKRPVAVFAAASGVNVLKDNPVVSELYSEIKSPVIYIKRISWYYLLVCSDGSVFLIMENGDILKKFDTVSGAGVALTSEVVELYTQSNGNYLVLGAEVFRLDIGEEAELTPLWKVESSQGSFEATQAGMVEYNGQRVSLYSLENGEKTVDYTYSGSMLLPPVALNGVVYIITGSRDGKRVELTALDTADRDDPLLWSYSLDTPVELLTAGEDRVYVLTGRGRLLGFER